MMEFTVFVGPQAAIPYHKGAMLGRRGAKTWPNISRSPPLIKGRTTSIIASNQGVTRLQSTLGSQKIPQSAEERKLGCELSAI